MIKAIKRFLRHRVGVYTPEELGFDFPEVKLISIDGCVFGVPWDWSKNLAHAHSSIICLGTRGYLYNDLKEPGDFVWHEYAHILASQGTDPEADQHGEFWVLQLTKLNKEYVAFPYTNSVQYMNDMLLGTVRASNLNG